ncbi:DUF4399 domain-containing protein [Oleiagrimonas soli]|uniref:Putative PhzF superfamily epimerase YddE/YHI9 n=1 Tax=Oleiagrimonas soli TaxID=1543381 RepID=A0A099CXD8_9GAMM|nr:DUF4399 domain-containing protein [Oleiagrimonas soli]KGI77680.1 rod shape-determining protein RodA [Oleiagrimonas soli]MBB6182794.1 putative PhzF superfamily epimerase YddE/YHI9 [Oleiagrimonas soli]
MKRAFLLAILTTACTAAMAAQPVLQATTRPSDAKVYIVSPRDGATVPRTFTVRFGLRGMGVAPAGVERADTGHHHLLIDVKTLPAAGQAIPADAHHRHFGGGQTETVLTLSPGTHTLQLELADSRHVPFATPLLSRKITVHVK